MIRTQIQLTDEQAVQVRHLAAERGVSMAELIRFSVDRLLETTPHARDRDDLRDRARELAGRFSSGVSDLAAGHDRHLSKIYGE